MQIQTQIQKRQNTNGSIKEQPFISRESKKLYSLHREKKIVPACEIPEFLNST